MKKKITAGKIVIVIILIFWLFSAYTRCGTR